MKGKINMKTKKRMELINKIALQSMEIEITDAFYFKKIKYNFDRINVLATADDIFINENIEAFKDVMQ